MHDVPSTNERNQEHVGLHRKAYWDKLVLLARGVPMGTEYFRETHLMISISFGGFLRQSLLLHSTGQPGTHCVNQAGLKHWGPPASPFQSLALQVCATTLKVSLKGKEMFLF